MSRHPTLKWAQRSDKVYITIELPDAKDVKLKLEPDGRFYFSAKSGADDSLYEIDILLHYAVNVEESKAAVGLRNICYLVKKAETKWWGRLLKQEGKPPLFVKVDWDKWIDEDDENPTKSVETDMDFGGMDFSNLNMGGPEEFEDVDELKYEDDEETEAITDEGKDKSEGASGSAEFEAAKD